MHDQLGSITERKNRQAPLAAETEQMCLGLADTGEGVVGTYGCGAHMKGVLQAH